MSEPDPTQRELLHFLRESIDATRELRGAVDLLRAEIERNYVRKDVYEADRSADAIAGRAQDEKLNALLSIRDWMVKIIVGAVVLALLGVVLVTNTGGPPL